MVVHFGEYGIIIKKTICYAYIHIHIIAIKNCRNHDIHPYKNIDNLIIALFKWIICFYNNA